MFYQMVFDELFFKIKCFWSKTSLINLSGLFLIEQKWSKTFLSTFFVWWANFLINCFWSIVFDRFYFDELKLLIKMFLIDFFNELNLLINFFWSADCFDDFFVKKCFDQKLFRSKKVMDQLFFWSADWYYFNYKISCLICWIISKPFLGDLQRISDSFFHRLWPELL